jgi:AcrR family transcriptional regulator
MGMEQAFSRPARALIEAGERLIAEQGLRVPLREIGLAAGAANKVAVQYHFGDRDRLIDAIFRYRLPRLEERRSALLAQLGPKQRRTAALMDVLLRPIAEVVDEEGRRSYAGFLYQLTATARSARAAFDPLSPVAKRATALIRQSLAGMDQRRFNRRLGSASLVFLDTLVRLEEEGGPQTGGVDEALTLAVAVLTAP